MVAALRFGTTPLSIHFENGSMAMMMWWAPSYLAGCIGPTASKHQPRNGILPLYAGDRNGGSLKRLDSFCLLMLASAMPQH
jgi:hypothetical protein